MMIASGIFCVFKLLKWWAFRCYTCPQVFPHSFIQNAGLGHGHFHFYLLCPFPVNSEGKTGFKSQRGLERDHMALFWTKRLAPTPTMFLAPGAW